MGRYKRLYKITDYDGNTIVGDDETITKAIGGYNAALRRAWARNGIYKGYKIECIGKKPCKTEILELYRNGKFILSGSAAKIARAIPCSISSVCRMKKGEECFEGYTVKCVTE